MSELMDKVVANSKRLREEEKAVYAQVERVHGVETPRFPLSPSAATKPMRDLYYSLVNYFAPGSIPVDVMEPRVHVTFKLGHIIEAQLLAYFQSAYQVTDVQRNVKFGEVENKDGTTRPLTGSIDWSIVIEGRNVLCDSKSSASFPFTKAPKEDNISQMQLYMHSDWGRANNVNEAWLAYFNKDTSELKIISIAYDKQLATELLNRLYQVWANYLSGTIPPREYLLGHDWQANYSNYRTYDNAEFVNTQASHVTANTNCLPLLEHVNNYGSAYVRYQNGTFKAQLKGKKLALIDVNQPASEWEDAG